MPKLSRKGLHLPLSLLLFYKNMFNLKMEGNISDLQHFVELCFLTIPNPFINFQTGKSNCIQGDGALHLAACRCQTRCQTSGRHCAPAFKAQDFPAFKHTPRPSSTHI